MGLPTSFMEGRRGLSTLLPIHIPFSIILLKRKVTADQIVGNATLFGSKFSQRQGPFISKAMNRLCPALFLPPGHRQRTWLFFCFRAASTFQAGRRLGSGGTCSRDIYMLLILFSFKLLCFLESRPDQLCLASPSVLN